MTKDQMPADIEVRGTTGEEKVKLERLEAKEAKETLGVFLSVEGNNREYIIKLKEKAEKFAEKIRTAKTSKEKTWWALEATTMKTLEYFMEATNLEKKEWEEIMQPICRYVVPKAGLNRNFSRQVMYTPKELYGMGIMNPWHKQHLRQIYTLLISTNRNSMTGDLIKASAEQLRLEMGTKGFFLT